MIPVRSVASCDSLAINLMYYKVITILGNNAVQIIEWIAVVTDMQPIIYLQEFTFGR